MIPDVFRYSSLLVLPAPYSYVVEMHGLICNYLFIMFEHRRYPRAFSLQNDFII